MSTIGIDVDITYTFNENTCEIKVPITKRVKNVTKCDFFIYEYLFVLVSEVEVHLFESPRKFNHEEMKNICICFNSEHWEYTCILPCYPDENKTTTKKALVLVQPCMFICITDSCVLSVDGNICEIQADFPYGFAGLYRSTSKYNQGDLSHICRIPDPSRLSPFKRTCLRENDETKNFSRDQYKISFVDLQLPKGFDNPMKYTVLYNDVNLTKEEESILDNIKSKHPHIDVETDKMDIDFGLVSILLAICYDIRTTSNEPTCESAWTRSILSPVLSYFEQFENLQFVVQSFMRQSVVYPLYRNYELSRLCVQDAVDAMQKGKPWLLKQLLVTYNCFLEAEVSRKALNKYYIKHYIWYVDTVMDDDHLQMLSTDLSNVLASISEEDLRLGIKDIQIEMLAEILSDIRLEMGTALQADLGSISEGSASESESESEYESDVYSSDEPFYETIK